ncbi:MAG TPA: hypothetical protein VM140_07795 [Burkholderiales bacterium]|nr:hypothetical protein [Burkholderiales bacterium]
MKTLPSLIVAAALAAPLPTLAADDEDKTFGHLLTLMQTFTSIAAQSARPELDIADVLAGKNERANRAASGLMQEITAEMPPAYRTQMSAIGADLVSIARRNATLPPPASSSGDALQARKDLTAMGLRYFDASQFVDAVQRDDALAVELYIAGQGVNLSSRDAQGRSALEVARANGNERIAALLSRNLRAER